MFEVDLGADSVIDYRSSMHNTYDAHRNIVLQRTEADSNHDGILDSVVIVRTTYR